MRIEKVGLKKFLYFQKVPGFDLPEYPCKQKVQSVMKLLIKGYMYSKKRNKT